MINNYNELIGTTYYLSNTPYAIIENIMAMNNGYYRLFLKGEAVFLNILI